MGGPEGHPIFFQPCLNHEVEKNLACFEHYGFDKVFLDYLRVFCASSLDFRKLNNRAQLLFRANFSSKNYMIKNWGPYTIILGFLARRLNIPTIFLSSIFDPSIIYLEAFGQNFDSFLLVVSLTTEG